MKYVGIDLHKHSITICVVNQSRQILLRKCFSCAETSRLRTFLAGLGPFQAVVEATASYDWLVRLTEPLAQRVVLAHPKKLRVIAESTRKSDRLDAQVLAEFLALDMIPASYRPTPRQHDHRRLVRHRAKTSQRITSVRNRLRRLLADYNADVPWLFTRRGETYLAETPLSAADRFVADALWQRWSFLRRQQRAVEAELRNFAAASPLREQEARALLGSIPGVGFVTTEVVLSELAGIDRFTSGRQVVAYAGLAPGQRESAGKRQELHLDKSGSKLLRWAVVEAAWRLVRHSQRWRVIYQRLRQRLRAKKAIVAIARRLLTVMVAVLRSGQPYRHATASM